MRSPLALSILLASLLHPSLAHARTEANTPPADSAGPALAQAAKHADDRTVPGAEWERRRPSELGLNDDAIAAAVEWAKTQGSDWDFSRQHEIFGRSIGPLPASRAATNGVIIKNGFLIAEFGDVRAVDPTYSVAKSYLATLVGLMIDRGLIADENEPVGRRVHDGGFDPAPDTPHHPAITWAHFLTMTSEWTGSLFDKSSDFIGEAEYGRAAQKPRERREPGTYFEYNDVRINRCALAMLRLWQRPLEDVLRTEIMNPIGASNTWKWVPYDNATVTVDVRGVPTQLPSVSGGTRWGGGLWMNTLDHARFALLIARGGRWADRQILSPDWISRATRQQGVKSDYGYLWWLNNEGRWPAASRAAFSAQGAGDHSIFIDPTQDLVIVWRWHKGNDTQAEFYRRVLAAIQPALAPAGAPADAPAGAPAPTAVPKEPRP